MNDGTLPSSFRDPSGFLFRRGGVLYRQVNLKYKDDYDRLIESGLYKTLTDGGLLVPHVETDAPPEAPADAYKVIKPEEIPFISYPYEWCFSQLKAAALATLTIQKKALDHGMSLKDASAYNIQFASGRPLLVDTLSFERYEEGRPWVAYRQFCQHFLAPLALMSRTDVRLSQLLKVYIDGVPLDLASKLLPMRTRLSFGLLTHIHINARFQARYADRQVKASEVTKRKMSRMGFLGLINSLESTVKGLAYKAAGTEWADYYSDTNYTREALEAKARIVGEFLDAARPGLVWDLGANTGTFSRIAAEGGARIVAFDIDPAAVERHYLECTKTNEKGILPLVADLTNPSPAIGWQNRERAALIERGPADVAMALALVHHLAISNNVPLGMLAEFFAEIAGGLIIEFVPKSDSQVQRLLATREDIFRDYNEAQFERAFEGLFVIERKAAIPGSERSLYLMRKRAGRG
jgi:ribosomal protein L11 methylase PrmA